jgi:hypothetical protein
MPGVEVQQCPLRAKIGEEIGDKLAWSRRNWRRRKRRRWRRRRKRRRIRKITLKFLKTLTWQVGNKVEIIDIWIIIYREI